MPKQSVSYRCLECSAVSSKWAGRCFSCEAWGSLEKWESRDVVAGTPGQTIDLSQVEEDRLKRIKTGISEVDRCLGGGAVPGSVVLLGGDPGIGKSTLALQMAGMIATGHSILYICGEESPAQIKLRASRLGLGPMAGVVFLADTDLNNILATVNERRPDFLVIDSIQTVYSQESSGAPGSVAQVSGAAAKIAGLAKRENISTLIIGHVTKEGYIAGPKTLEHMVDAVLYLEGERFQQLRLLRAVKNRFGNINEVGVFEMASGGLLQVDNPSVFFLDREASRKTGAAQTCVLEGSRVLVCEIQALLSKSSLAYPRRTGIGIDPNRLWLLLAVMSRHGKMPVHQHDVYVNVAGGLKVGEPAVDLAVSVAAASSLLDLPVPTDTVFLGELGLSGEIRPVTQVDKRLKEAERLGFEKAVVPARQKIAKTKLTLIRVGDIKELLSKIFPRKKLS